MTALSMLPVPTFDRPLPRVIQGGMGIAVSSWRLASAVARAGQLGVVSGTALDLVLARRLQDGDPDGAVRRALAAFPVPTFAHRVVKRYFRAGGRAPREPYAPIPRLALRQTRLAQELMILGAFVEVWLAKEGHGGQVGINFLEKVQMATPTAAYGSMLAGADYVVMGAGIPRDIPHLLDRLAGHEAVDLPVEVSGAPAGHSVRLDPAELLDADLPPLTRPTFLAIVSAHALASYLARDSHICPDGFVVEGSRAGGHNAPPRGRLTLDDLGQPVFGPRDEADVAKVAAIGLPFWLAGSQGTPEALATARAAGAAGVQVGTVFALAQESGLDPSLRDDLLTRLRAGTLEIRTDPFASPTGFPFKVAQVPGTLSDPEVLADRPRLCDLGYLRTPYQRETGAVGYRCPAEPVHVYVRKGGAVEDTVGRVCLCNALTADVGLGQQRADGHEELGLLTLGVDIDGAKRLATIHPGEWTAREALDWLIGATG
ncbi:NAD(P)H-dependent flavin oxidoreductase YrpB, nitropropane dioxygenase family [Sanguibacter gelidistatuariae]|uniref:NAD(P)H-dependent flavin oxidoreductase YrpB, nitropropane dioxygenase family n=1 Tax=Sanguibacter gelidistatuariae TaxID=1814289 RepID=A0A1G6QJM7_9MICO|nr:nitronate monooxygenase [Sanguibacter gelidistatuariae]SDC92682.1 NAD(P)H-dependent flavin oxidoreductase YrpB, nitropropane dioxygenase family [Sanguibacter gelidistatuariae]